MNVSTIQVKDLTLDYGVLDSSQTLDELDRLDNKLSSMQLDSRGKYEDVVKALWKIVAKFGGQSPYSCQTMALSLQQPSSLCFIQHPFTTKASCYTVDVDGVKSVHSMSSDIPSFSLPAGSHTIATGASNTNTNLSVFTGFLDGIPQTVYTDWSDTTQKDICDPSAFLDTRMRFIRSIAFQDSMQCLSASMLDDIETRWLQSIYFSKDSRLTAIAPSALQYSSIKRLVLPPSTLSIGERAFSDCSLLEEVWLPKGRVAVDPTAFLNCACKFHYYDENQEVVDLAMEDIAAHNSLFAASSPSAWTETTKSREKYDILSDWMQVDCKYEGEEVKQYRAWEEDDKYANVLMTYKCDDTDYPYWPPDERYVNILKKELSLCLPVSSTAMYTNFMEKYNADGLLLSETSNAQYQKRKAKGEKISWHTRTTKMTFQLDNGEYRYFPIKYSYSSQSKFGPLEYYKSFVSQITCVITADITFLVHDHFQDYYDQTPVGAEYAGNDDTESLIKRTLAKSDYGLSSRLEARQQSYTRVREVVDDWITCNRPLYKCSLSSVQD